MNFMKNMNNKYMENKQHSIFSSFQFRREFKIDDSHKELTIWKIYHDKSQTLTYKLLENKTTYLFNTRNLGYAGKNINHLNRLFCEGVGYLYPYFNNLKSEIIGFQHYRRTYNSDYNVLKIDEIKQGKVQVFDNRPAGNYIYLHNINTEDQCINILSHCCFWRMYECGFYNDIIEYLSNNFPEYLESENTLHNLYGFSLFVSNWDKYVKFCNLFLGYITFIADKYKFNVYNENDWVNFIKEYFIFYNRKHHVPQITFSWQPNYPFGAYNWINDDYINDPLSFHYYRLFSFNFEFFVSMFAYKEGIVIDENNMCKCKYNI